MSGILAWWQHLPASLDPVLFSVGSVAIRWYGIAYLLGFLVVYLVAKRRLARPVFDPDVLWDALLSAFLGAVIGGRIGYVLLYAPAYYVAHPIGIISPIDAAGVWVGISGMSFFGGALGVTAALALFARLKNISLLTLLDTLIIGLPLAIFFVRIANFINGELIGRITDWPWGVYFPSDRLVLRHPSQLYEAILEGLLVFAVLVTLRRRAILLPGGLGAMFLLSYGAARFFAEFFREPDLATSLFAFGLSLNQVLALLAVLIGGNILWWLQKSKSAILGQPKG